MSSKLTSRKFWICVAAFLGSVAASISGLVTDNKYVTTIGVVAGILSAAIYAFCEAWVDSKSATRTQMIMYVNPDDSSDPGTGNEDNGEE